MDHGGQNPGQICHQQTTNAAKPKSRLLAMKNKLRKKQEHRTSLKQGLKTSSEASKFPVKEAPAIYSSTTDYLNGMHNSRSEISSHGLPLKPRSRTVELCVSNSNTEPPLLTTDKRSHSMPMDILGMSKFANNNTSSMASRYLEGPSAQRPGHSIKFAGTKFEVGSARSSVVSPTGLDHPKLVPGDDRLVDKPPPGASYFSRSKHGQKSLRSKLISRRDNLRKVPIQRSLEMIKPVDCMGNNQSTMSQEYTCGITGENHQGYGDFHQIPVGQHLQMPSYFREKNHAPSLEQKQLTNGKRLSRSLDNVTMDKEAELSKLSAESDPLSYTTDHITDTSAYLREWAVAKPKSVLLSSRENLKPMEDAEAKQGKSRWWKKDSESRFDKLCGHFHPRPSSANAVHRSNTLSIGNLFFKTEGYHRSEPTLHMRRSSEVSSGPQAKFAGDHVKKPESRLKWARVPRAKLKAERKQAGSKTKSNLKVTNPEDAKYQRGSQDGSTCGTGTGFPRRHTVTVSGGSTDKQKDLDIEKAAFLEHLARKYPDHAKTIKAVTDLERPQESNRRHTTQISKTAPDGHQVVRSRPIPVQALGPRPHPQRQPADNRTSPPGAFTRGDRLRSSLPVVRSPNKSLDQPLGLIFLTFRNETKRALLPNEVTSQDTVKALFVRSFSDTLSMQWFEIPGHKIYILDQSTNVYYELDNIRDVKDRAVLKIYEPDHPHGPPPSPSPHSPPAHTYAPPPAYGTHPGSAYQAVPPSMYQSVPPPGPPLRSPGHHRPASPCKRTSVYAEKQEVTKAQSHPDHPRSLYACPQTVQHLHAPPHPAQCQCSPRTEHRTLPVGTQGAVGPKYLQAPRTNPASPHRGNQRHSLAYLPDSNLYEDCHLTQSHSYHGNREGGSAHTSGRATPTQEHDPAAKKRMDHMEAQLASLAAWVQTTVMKTQSEVGSRPSSARSNNSVISEGSYSTKSSMSDVSTATPQPTLSLPLQEGMQGLQRRTKELKSDLYRLRRLQETNMETIRDTIQDTYSKLKEVIDRVPGAAELPIRARRRTVDSNLSDFQLEANKVQKDLVDLETSVEELRDDVLNRKCRVNMSEVENMALALSTITAALGDLKAHFPALQVDMKAVMQGEMQVVVQEEKLSLVQEHKPPLVPDLCTASPKEEDRQAVLDNIKAMVPNHRARFSSIQAAEDARERKKKIDTKGEVLRFEKSLAMVSKSLKDPTQSKEQVSSGKASSAPAKDKVQVPQPKAVSDGPKSGSPSKSKVPARDAVISDAPGNYGNKRPASVTSPDTSGRGVTSGLESGGESFRIGNKSADSTIKGSGGLELSVTSGVIDSPGQSMHLNADALPTSTSTPKSDSNAACIVTPDTSVCSTLAVCSSPAHKKVPPPPPPRRSSHTTMKSPGATQAIADDAPSHMYENIEKLNIRAGRSPKAPTENSKVQSATSSKGKPSSVKPASEKKPRPTSLPESISALGQSKCVTDKMRQLNKFQQELAAVSGSSLTSDSPGTQSPSSSSSSTSLESQLGGDTGTIKRKSCVFTESQKSAVESQQNDSQKSADDSQDPNKNSQKGSQPPTKDEQLASDNQKAGIDSLKSANGQQGAKDTQQLSKDSPPLSKDGQQTATKVRKVPPPPPERKCSTLSQEARKAAGLPDRRSQNIDGNDPLLEKVTQQAPVKVQNGAVNVPQPKDISQNNVVSNGKIPQGQNGRKRGKTNEETDIY